MQFTHKNTIDKKISAVIICLIFDKIKAYKYSHVHNSERGINTFIHFSKKKPGAIYINFYSIKTGEYLGRTYLNNLK